jgi:hypothetical protein
MIKNNVVGSQTYTIFVFFLQGDVYLSFNVENSEVRHWTTHVLINNLEDKGYRVCMPPRDFEVGGTQMEQIHSQITGSRSFIVILSDDYLESQFQSLKFP